MPKGVRSDIQVARLQVENDSLKDRIKDKDELINRLLQQITGLQEALVSKEAPEAYRSLQREKAEANLSEADLAKREAAEQEIKILDEYNRVMERDRLLETPDDLRAAFVPIFMEATEPGSTHNNSES